MTNTNLIDELELIQASLDNLKYGFDLLSYEERAEVRSQQKELLSKKRDLNIRIAMARSVA